MIYLISYDLKYPGRDYTNLISEIKSLGNWAKPLESVWLVDTNIDILSIVSKLRSLDLTDKLFVVHVSNPWRSVGLDQIVADWIQNRVI